MEPGGCGSWSLEDGMAFGGMLMDNLPFKNLSPCPSTFLDVEICPLASFVVQAWPAVGMSKMGIATI